MKRLLEGAVMAGPCSWTVTVSPPVAGDAAWRSRLLDVTRRDLERRLADQPEATEFTLRTSLLAIQVRREAGTWRAGAEMHLRYQEPAPNGRENVGSGRTPPLIALDLPDERLARQGERLVGLDRVQEEILLRLRCAWDGQLADWSERTGTPLAPAVTAALAERVPLFVLAGDPGVGKSALTRMVADRYCRQAETAGSLLWLGTAARGNGLVGDFGNQLRAAFDAACRKAAEAPCFLVIDEADALAMRRSEGHAHQEDRAGTATLLQALDGVPEGARLAVFLTTNLLPTVDAAVRRRATTYVLDRPDTAGRRRLLERWLPGGDRKTLGLATRAASGMTPADMERALGRACLEAVGRDEPLTAERVITHLRQHERTESV